MENSKGAEQPMCPCGFYGSSKTLGLCSKCYKAHLEKSKEALKSTPDHMISTTEAAHVTVTYPEASSSKSESEGLSDKELICITHSNSSTGTSDGNQNNSPSPSTSAETTGPSPEKKASKRDISNVEPESTPESTPEKQSQKIKKRCFHCKCKLELAQRQIGRCKCENVFCALHRLPELHNCEFDHKEDGRREAREKMIKPVRHLGTSFKRLDTDT